MKGEGQAPFSLPAATLAVSTLTPSLPSPRKMPKTVVVLLRSLSRRRCSSCPWGCCCGDTACNGDAACDASDVAETREGGGCCWPEGVDGGTGSSWMTTVTPQGDQGVNDVVQRVLCPSPRHPAWCRRWKLLRPQKPTAKGLCEDWQGWLPAHHLLSCSSRPSAHSQDGQGRWHGFDFAITLPPSETLWGSLPQKAEGSVGQICP